MVVDDPEAHLPMVIVVIHLRTGLFLTWYLTQHEPTCHLVQRAEMQCAMLLDPQYRDLVVIHLNSSGGKCDRGDPSADGAFPDRVFDAA